MKVALKFIFFSLLTLSILTTPVDTMATTTNNAPTSVGVANTPHPAWLHHIQKLFPTMTSYTITETIVQPNALGYKVQLQYNENDNNIDNDNTLPDMVFVKDVNASNYIEARKDWPDLRRTLLYARTEARFYQDMLPVLRTAGFDAAPRVYTVWHDLEGWVAETERSIDLAAAGAVDINDDTMKETASAKGCCIVMECVSATTHFQAAPLTISHAKQCLAAAARLHAAAWQDVPLLQRASGQLSRASFHLEMRNPKELAGMQASWEHFVTHFRDDLMQAGGWSDSVQALGKRMAVAAPYISQQLSPAPTDKYVTLIHGDYKAMNVLLPVDPTTNKAVLVDYASIGIGLGMSDVAMHLHHAVTPADLADGGEDGLVEYYCQTLRDALPGHDYPTATALWHYQFACCDYFRFFLGRMWKTATHDTMQQKSDNKNTALINRSVASACAFVGRVDAYLAEIEQEYLLLSASKQEL